MNPALSHCFAMSSVSAPLKSWRRCRQAVEAALVPAATPAPATLPPPPPDAATEVVPSSVTSVYESAGAGDGLSRLRDLLGKDLCGSAGEQPSEQWLHPYPLPTHMTALTSLTTHS